VKRLAVGPLPDQTRKFTWKIVGMESQGEKTYDIFRAEYVERDLVALLVGCISILQFLAGDFVI
jgi:hypothetical protein